MISSGHRRVVTHLGVACLAVAALGVALVIYLRVNHVDQVPQTPRLDSVELLRDVQSSHVDANVPSGEDFDRFLRRDLGEYFAKERGKTVAIDFESLRVGPTQSGVSFPKFYVWIRIAGGQSLDDRGAVRVAAVERSRFNVTDFVSERAIRAEPAAIYRVFPAPVCERIKEKLAPK